MENSATINSTVTEGGTINTTVTTGSTIATTLTGGGIGPQGPVGQTGPVGPQGPVGPTGSFPYFNVMNYGAVGDGVHDDSDDIQDAITEAASNGGTVFFPTPPNLYKITKALVLYTGVSLLGEGSEAVEISQTTNNVDGIDATDAASISIQGIYLSGTSTGTGIGINMNWVDAGNVPYLDFRDVKVYNWGSDGIAIETPIVSTFTNVVCKSNGGYGVNFYHAGTSCVFSGCWMRENVQAGYHFYESVYMNLSGCAADGNGVGYLVENAQSIGFYACGAESQVVGAGIWDGTGFKISNSSVVGLHNVWLTNNPAIGIWVTNGSIATEIFGAADNSPGGTATAFVQTDVSTNATVSDVHNTTADSYSPGTVTVLNDGANGMLTKQLTVKDSSGSLIITAAPDGGQFNMEVDTTGVLALFGQGGQVLNLELLDGYLQLDTLTATTVPYMDANKRFVSSSVTPTELGYVHGVTSAIQTQLAAKQATITLTTTGTSGAATFSGGTLNIPNYAAGMTNPMTSVGDLIQGGTSGAPARLASVATGNVLISGGVTTASSWGKVGISTHVSGLGTGIATALGVNTGSAGAPVLFNGAGGTPTSLTLTNATGLVASTGTTATGTPSSTTYLRGDNTWSTPAGGFTSPLTTLGDIMYENATPAAARLAGSTSATMAVLTQTGTGTVSAAPAWVTTTGTGSIVAATSPTLVTPTLGAATATTINKVTITAPTTSATLTLVTGSSLITAGAFALTLTSGQSTNVTIPTTSAMTMARIDAAQTFAGVQTFSAAPSFAALPTGAGVASAATASTLAARDANKNLTSNQFIEGYTSVTTAAGTTTLTVGSTENQVFTGTSTQTVVLPVVSTLALGTSFTITNLSTGNVTVQSSGANTIVVLGLNQTVVVTNNAITGTAASVWNFVMDNAVLDYRNNNGTGVVEYNSHMETGAVGSATGTNSAFSVSVTWAHAFASLPVVIPSPAGDASSAVGYGSAGFNIKRFAVQVTSVSTTGASFEIYTTDGTGWATGDFAYFTYLAMGV